MARSPIGWLYRELPTLVRTGVLDETAAERLRAHYGPEPSSIDRSRVLLAVFGVVGATLVGAGVVLVLAHNWEALTRPLRASLAFALLVAAQVLTGWALVRRRSSIAWTEATAAGLAMAVVASIALIAQTYHLPGDPRTLLLTWIVLVAPIPYLTGSRTVAALIWPLGSWWLLAGRTSEDRGWLGWAVAVAVAAPFLIHLVRRHRDDPRTALVGWAACVSVLAALPRIADVDVDGLWIPLVGGYLGACCAYGDRGESSGPAARSWTLRPWTVVGTGGLTVLTFLFGFHGLWSDVLDGGGGPGLTSALVGVPLASGVALVGLTLARAPAAWRAGRRARALLMITPGWASVGWWFGLSGNPSIPTALAILGNAAAIAIGAAACVEGSRRDAIGEANGGLALISATAIARFFDVDVPFVARGVAFIAVGLGFLAVNLRIVRRRRART